MSAQDNIEKILRSLHVLLSKSEPYAKEPSKVIVDKQEMLELLSQLNKGVYEIMEEYELTKQSRDKAEREFRKKGDEIIWDASRKAEDIYAASVMYTDEALSHVQAIVKEANESMQEVYAEMDRKLQDKESMLRKNQLELKAQLQDLVDTEKYLKLIEERNREIQREKDRGKGKEEASIYANRQTEVRINQAYFEKMGIPIEEESKEESDAPDEAELSAQLDADYFDWKEENEQETSKKGKSEGIVGVLKGLTGPKKSQY